MINNILILLMFVFTANSVLSQKVKDSSLVKTDLSYNKSIKLSLLSQNKKVYSMAMDNQDYVSAKVALYNIIATEPENALAWQDTLCRLYFITNAYQQCIAAGRDYLKYAIPNSPKNTNILAMIAFSEKNLINWKEALNTFEEVYPKSGNVYHLYQIAELQYLLKRYAECEITIDSLMKRNDVAFSIPVSGTQMQAQAVPLKAAAINLKGIMLFDIKKKNEASVCFQEAIKIFPDFILAKENLKMSTKKETPAVNKK